MSTLLVWNESTQNRFFQDTITHNDLVCNCRKKIREKLENFWFFFVRKNTSNNGLWRIQISILLQLYLFPLKNPRATRHFFKEWCSMTQNYIFIFFLVFLGLTFSILTVFFVNVKIITQFNTIFFRGKKNLRNRGTFSVLLSEHFYLDWWLVEEEEEVRRISLEFLLPALTKLRSHASWG